MSGLYDKIEQQLEDLQKIEQAIHQVTDAFNNGGQTEDLNQALQHGIETLEEMEKKHGGTDL